MKYDSMRAFQKHLQSAGSSHVSSTYLLLSKDPFDLKEASNAIHETLGEGTAVVRMNPEREGIKAILDELCTLSLFKGIKLVFVEEAEKIGKKEQERLDEWMKGQGRGICLSLLSTSLKRNSALFHSVEKHGVVLDIPEAKPWQKDKEAVEWIKERAEMNGLVIEQAAAALLAEWIGSDKEALASELEKLALYSSPRGRITAKDVSALSEGISKESVFKLAEALLNRDGKRALVIQAGLKKEGVQPIAEIRVLRQQFEVELQVAILASSKSDEAITELFPYMKGFILQQHKKQALSYGVAALKKGLIAIDKAELMLKSVSVDPEIIVDKLIAELC